MRSHCLHSEAWPDCLYQCFPSVITCTARHSQIVLIGVAPWSSLAQQGMARKRMMVLALGHYLKGEAWQNTILPCSVYCAQSLLAQRGMARLCLPVLPLGHHLHNEAWLVYYTVPYSHCLHSKAWPDCVYQYCCTVLYCTVCA